MRRLLTFFLAAAIAVVPMVTMPGCSLIQKQRQTLAEMSAQDFAKLQADFRAFGEKAGQELKGKLDPADLRYVETAIKVIFEKSNSERGKLLAALLNDPKYQPVVATVVGAALDLLEASIGKRIELESLGVTTREAALLESFMLGILDGIK